MDTSPEYIKMCRMAHELQEMWEPNEGDYFHASNENTSGILGSYAISMGGNFYETDDIDTLVSDEWLITYIVKHATIWLPRIDQLIELVMNDSPLKDKTAYGINKIQNIYCGDGRFKPIEDSDTIEMAWIKIYMSSKLKEWNGEDWI